MTEEMLRTVLETAEAKADKSDKEGWATLPEGRSLTFYVAHNGASLTVSKISAVRVAQGIVRAKSAKGQLFVIGVQDIFAAALDGAGEPSAVRKTGFLG
ncbi:MAG: hypothetical protein HUU21_14715 [Polyangiaceae bacterium]|nr:hypothetical protein [Polyangiaceae bacterium]